jgi:hypothetical protein
MAKTKDILILYIVLCFVGTFLEWAYGTLWSLCGQTPWIYPDSILKYASFETFPLWGVAGLFCATVYRAYTNRSWKISAWLILLLALAAIWILFYELVIQ